MEIDNKSVILNLLENDGQIKQGVYCEKIYTYLKGRHRSYSISFTDDFEDKEVLWSRKGGITERCKEVFPRFR